MDTVDDMKRTNQKLALAWDPGVAYPEHVNQRILVRNADHSRLTDAELKVFSRELDAAAVATPVSEKFPRIKRFDLNGILIHLYN